MAPRVRDRHEIRIGSNVVFPSSVGEAADGA